ATVFHAEPETFDRGERSQKLRAFEVRRPKLQVRVSRTADRARREERAAQVRSTAARAPDDPGRRPLEGRQPRVEDACLVQHLQRTGVVVDVDLKPRRVLECLALEGAD